jgi:hypothetical protein
VATARERLLQALHAIISKAYTEEGKGALRRLLNSYRVQAKPGEVIEKEQTARDVLAGVITHTWQQKGSLEKKTILHLISPFRMQIKQGLSRSYETHSATLTGTKAHGDIESPGQSARSKVKENISRHQNAYFKDRNESKTIDNLESSIAGGPVAKKQSRGQCPKCRSMGVVLARTYGGDDYCSCIYCGYQAHIKASDAKLDLPLAAEILGATFGDPKLDPEE